MFTETILRPPARKIQVLVVAGAAGALGALGAAWRLFAIQPIDGGTTNGRVAGVLLVSVALTWICWSRARALTGTSLDVRKFGMVITRSRHDIEPLVIEWKEIERIETAVFPSFNGRSSDSTLFIGIRLADGSPKRHAKGLENNRRHSGCDILLPAIYGMSTGETVALLREKMREATGAQPAAPDVPDVPDESLDETPAPNLSLMHLGWPVVDTFQTCLEIKCPMCLGVQKFLLLEAPSRHGPYENNEGIKGLVCKKCHYAVLANDNAERAKLIEAAAIWATAESKAGAMSQILALKSDVIARIIQGAEMITCPECGEPVPAHFSECWKCGHVLKDLPPAEAFETPEQ